MIIIIKIIIIIIIIIITIIVITIIIITIILTINFIGSFGGTQQKEESKRRGSR